MTTAALPELEDYSSGSRWLREEYALLLIAALALALRLPWMAKSLWYDEISVTQRYLTDVFHLLDAWAWDSNMPVHYTMMFFWDKVFPDTEFSLRLPPLVFGLASILLTYQVARALFNRGVALLTCLLLSVSPVHIWYSAEARPYAGMMCFFLLAFLALVKLQGPSASSAKAPVAWLVVYFFSVLLGTLSHLYVSVLVVLLSGICVLHRKRALTVLGLNAIVFLLLACVLWFKQYVAGSIPTGAGYLRPFSAWEAWLLFFNWYSTGNTLSPLARDAAGWRDVPLVNLACQLFFSALFLKGSAAALHADSGSGRRWGAAALGVVFCIPLFLLAINAAGFRASYIERSCYVALPFYLMILARAATPARHNAWTVLLLSGLIGVSGLGTVWLFRNPDTCAIGSCKPDWRAAASYLKRDIASSGNRAATVGLLADRSLPYYDDGFADHVRLQRLRDRLPRMGQLASRIFGADSALPGAVRKEMAEVDSQLESDGRQKIAVLSLPEVSRAAPDSYDALYATETPRTRRSGQQLLQWLRQHDYRLTAEQSFPALHIYKFERRRSG